jgi:hypothetical protein
MKIDLSVKCLNRTRNKGRHEKVSQEFSRTTLLLWLLFQALGVHITQPIIVTEPHAE